LTSRAVIDSACFIALERIDRLELIPRLYKEVHAPPAVVDEIAHAPDWLLVRGASSPSLLKALRTQLEEGESAVIALASELENAVVVLDDKKARRVARQMGLRVVGTVGLLLRAKREHLVPEVKSLLESLGARRVPALDRAPSRSTPTRGGAYGLKTMRHCSTRRNVLQPPSKLSPSFPHDNARDL
jgi:predicted nucleic acid-binding protein